MTEAYDMKALGAKLKEKGLDLGEKAAGEVYVAVKEWFAESAAISKNPFDDIVVGLFPQVDAVVMPQIDKINGKEG